MSESELPAGTAIRPPPGVRLATRVTATLVTVVWVVVGGYMLVSYRQQRSQLEEEITQQVLLLGSVLHQPAEDLLNDQRLAELHQLLQLSMQADEVFAALILAADGSLIAGAAVDLPCTLRHLPSSLRPHRVSGTADCGDGVTWTILPFRTRPGWLLVAVEQLLLADAARSALYRQLTLLLVLTIALSAAITLILQRLVSRPLDAIMRSVRTLAATGTAPALRLSSSAGELAQLAEVLADTSTELQARRDALLRQTRERVELERRLAQSERFAMIGRLSGGLAHELGAPLSVIGMRADAIRSSAAHDPVIRSEAEAIGVEVGRVSSFVQGLLHISGRHGIVFDRVDMRAVVEEVADDVSPHADATGVELCVSVPSTPVWVRGQHATLCHALRNGVRNAIQALRDRRGRRRVDVRLRAGSDDVALVVDDTGPGIPADQLPRVTDPFFTTKPVGEGTGLGLAITQGIIEEHGGELAIENRSAGGVRLTLQLPADPYAGRSEAPA